MDQGGVLSPCFFSFDLLSSSFGPSQFSYHAFACYDLLDGGRQKLNEYGVWTGDTYVSCRVC